MKQFRMANQSVIFMFICLASMILVISMGDCMKRTQYHEQVSLKGDFIDSNQKIAATLSIIRPFR